MPPGGFDFLPCQAGLAILLAVAAAGAATTAPPRS